MSIDLTAFPKLTAANHRITSDPSPIYNCIAWAAGHSDAWWEPFRAVGYYWPPGIPEDYSVEALVALFASLGYVPCDSAAPEAGFEKLAIYGEQDEWEHATRQVEGSMWTSKLGADDDISHDGHDLLEGPKYATIVKIMRRPTK
jgi:hypothetical protein